MESDNNTNPSDVKKTRKIRTKKTIPDTNIASVDALLQKQKDTTDPLETNPPKKVVKRIKKNKETVKLIQELNDKDNHSEDNEELDPEEKEKEKDKEKESNIVTDKQITVTPVDEEKEVYGYLIIQEFPHINTTYVIGSKPFGKIWFDYTEVLEQFITILIDWQVDFDNKEIIHSKKPRIVKVRVF